jgi:hypothetical protein
LELGVFVAACAVSGKGSAGLSTLPLGLSGIRRRGTKTGPKKSVS